MISSDQFLARIAADFAKLIVDIGNIAADIRGADDGVLVERIALIKQFQSLVFLAIDHLGQLRQQHR